MRPQEIEYRPVVGYEGYYEVGQDGSIRSCDRVVRGRWGFRLLLGKGMLCGRDKDGYVVVKLSREGRTKSAKVHRIVMEAFKEPCPEGMEVAHNDGSKDNNAVGNLRYATPSENCLDRHLHGTMPDIRGERNREAKLTAGEVKRIRELRGAVTQARLGEMFGVSKSHISNVQARRVWGHV